MKLCSLFDGSGGFPLAGAMNGMTPVKYMMEACLAYAVLFMLMGVMALIWLPARWVMRKTRKTKEEMT